MQRKQKVVIVVGPTSSGKSALAVRLAKRFNGEVVSADSRQVYTGLDIGTGKVTKKEMEGVPHHMLDIVSPRNIMSAGAYAKSAHRACAEILERGRVPIITGGTGFYIDVLVGRIALPEVPVDTTLRDRLGKRSAASLFSLLKGRDAARARAMDTASERNNKVRLIRALEVAAALGTVPAQAPRTTFDVLWIGIAPPFDRLEKKIRSRLGSRIRAGMVAEAAALHRDGLTFRRMEQIGLEYGALARLLQKRVTRDEFEEELFRDIRRYAKKQLAYWKRNKAIVWFEAPSDIRIPKRVAAFLKK